MDPTAKPAIIYGLIDPRLPSPANIRYVGKTGSLVSQRLAQHIYEAKGGRKTHRHNWIRQLLAEGLAPAISVLETATQDGAAEKEREWIARLRAEGFRLTNLTDGGEGSPGYRPPPEVRAKLSALRVGKKRSPETCAKMSAANIGKKLSPEHRAKISAAQIGKTVSPACLAMLRTIGIGRHPSAASRAKMSAAQMGNKKALGHKNNLGRYHSDEARAKMSAARMGSKNHWFGIHLPEATRAKLSAAHIGKKQSPETRARISAAMLGRKVSPETIAKMSAAQTGNKNPNFGRHVSDETRARMSAAHMGNQSRLGCRMSPETRAILSAKGRGNKNSLGCKNNLGNHHSTEARAKMSASQRARRAAQKTITSAGRLACQSTP